MTLSEGENGNEILPPGTAPAGWVVETFLYPEHPWPEDLAGLSRRLADVFPCSRSGESASGSSEMNCHGSAHKHGSGGSEQDAPGGVEEQGMPGADGMEMDGEEQSMWLAEEKRKAEERGEQRGIEAGVATGRLQAMQQVEAERSRLHTQAAALLREFSGERERYLHSLERETVELSLAIAARVLRREAQMDPLMLLGAVRVALGQVAESTTVRLLVPMQDREMWAEAMALIPGLALRPEVIGEERMGLGGCRLETELGTVDLGVRSQLKEIERGFFDRVPAPRLEEAERAEGFRAAQEFTSVPARDVRSQDGSEREEFAAAGEPAR